MGTATQISVLLDNKPGRLANVLSALARDKVNLIALSVMDSHEHSVLRFVPHDASSAIKVLKSLGIPHTEAEILLAELRNHAGALAHVCELLGFEHINIDYAYCSAGSRNGKTMGVFKVSNTDKSLRILNGTPDVSTRRRLEGRPLRDKRLYQAPKNRATR